MKYRNLGASGLKVSEEWSAARLEKAQRIIEKYQLYPLTNAHGQARGVAVAIP